MRRVVVAGALLALVLPAQAAAHARLLYSTPADGEVVPAAPHSAVLRFDDTIVVGPGNAAVDARGRSVLSGGPSARGRTLRIPLTVLHDGSYTVRWSVVSDDGHNESGIIAFAVGAAGAPHATLSARGSGPSAADVLGRWLLVGGILVAAGASAFATAVARLRRVVVLAATGFVVAGVGAGVEWGRVPDGTRFAHAMVAVVCVAATGAPAALASARFGRAVPLLVAPSVAAVVAASVGGHVLDPGVTRLEVLVDVLHFAAASVWVGGLASLVIALPHLPAGSVRRFSRLALVSVALLAATGILRAVSELSSVGQLASTGYGRALLVKTVLFALLVALGYLGRSRLLGSAAALRRSVSLELVLAAGLVVAVAVLTSLAPGRVVAAAGPAPARPSEGPPPAPTAGAVTLAQQLGSNGVAVAVRPVRSAFSVRVTVLGSQGNGVDGLRVRVAGRPTASCGHGCYAGAAPRVRTLPISVGSQRVEFAIPPLPFRSGVAELRRIGERYLRARTVSFRERLSSGPGQVVTSTWRLQAPASLAFTASDGSSGVIVGGRRWDRQRGGRWVASPQSPRVPQPQVPWPGTPHNVMRLGEETIGGRLVQRLSFLDPATPAWYTVAADVRTHALVRVAMVAPAHFMRDDYRGLDVPFTIRPPR